MTPYLRKIFVAGRLRRFSFTALLGCFFMIAGGCSVLKPSASGLNHDNTPLTGIIDLYRGPLDHLSAVKIGECPMYPTCSNYAMQAIDKHGALMGWIMTCDRLMRCGRNEVDLSFKVLIDGKWKTYDTVAANDRWWYDTDRDKNNSELQGLIPSPEWEISIQ